MLQFCVQVLFLCFLVRSSVLTHATEEVGDTNKHSRSYLFFHGVEYPRDCKEIQKRCLAGNSSRVHLIQPDGFLEPFLAYCQDEWTMIQRREKRFITFNRNWKEYNNGFGFLNSEFWIGNEKLAYLTNQKQYELMISFETETGDSYHATYSKFRISDDFSDYSLVSVGQYTGTLGTLLTNLPSDCYDLQQAGYDASGDYTVAPPGWSGGPFTVNCNMDIDEGGWTVFQRRINGSEPFNLGWESYKEGFGTLSREFWIGNDKLAFFTNQRDYEIRIDLTNTDGESYYAKYDLFRITDESDNYRLVGLGTFSGTAGNDALEYHHYQAFSTIDRDNDLHADQHCALGCSSAWWYKNCLVCDLNRPYTGCIPYWSSLPGSDDVTYSEMKIRPVDKSPH